MEVIPAIDLRGGLCVRLIQGDYGRETVYSADPVEVALRWQQAGAPRLHIVDLDGARTGRSVNRAIISRIAAAVDIPLQVGGGVRHEQDAQELLNAGADRIVLGTIAARQPEVVGALCQLLGSERIVVAVDAREGRVAVEGWQEHTSFAPLDLTRLVANLGARRVLYTDISRDGTLTEPNFQVIEEMIAGTSVSVLASGGVSSLDHVKRLVELGVEGTVLGKALYTGDVDLAEAIQAAGLSRP